MQKCNIFFLRQYKRDYVLCNQLYVLCGATISEPMKGYSITGPKSARKNMQENDLF